VTNTKNSNTSTAQLLAEAIRFEHWARFHCMHEVMDNRAQEHTPKDAPIENTSQKNMGAENISTENINAETAFIQVPEILVTVCKEENPHLVELLECIQDTEISLDSARTHILTFLKNELKLDDEAFSQEIQTISASKKFTRYLDVFYTFVQEEADLEEQEFTEKEAEIGAEAMPKYIAEVPIPTFSAWTEKFYQWASQRNFRLELE